MVWSEMDARVGEVCHKAQNICRHLQGFHIYWFIPLMFFSSDFNFLYLCLWRLFSWRSEAVKVSVSQELVHSP